jgi:hypothetical protein
MYQTESELYEKISILKIMINSSRKPAAVYLLQDSYKTLEAAVHCNMKSLQQKIKPITESKYNLFGVRSYFGSRYMHVLFYLHSMQERGTGYPSDK